MRARLPVLLALAGLLLLAVLAAAGTSSIPTGSPDLSVDQRRDDPQVDVEVPPISSEPFVYPAALLTLLGFIGVLLGLAIFLAALAGIRIRFRRRLQRTARALAGDTAAADVGWLAGATRRALAELDRQAGGPPSDAVIAAWIELERSAAATGVEREAHQTPTEFTSAIIADHTVDISALKELRGLYHRARFGTPGDVTADDATAARRALEKIV
jgi:hypothetical protein